MPPFDGMAIEGVADLAFLEEQAPNLRSVFDVTGFRASAWRTRGAREIRSGAESQANKFSSSTDALIRANSAANSGRNSAQMSHSGTEGSNSLRSTIQSESCHETPPDAGRPWS